MSFDKLLADLEEVQALRKSMSDDKVEDNDNDDKGGDDDDKELLGKSQTFTDEDGKTIDAIDGTELVKSLMAQMDEQKTAFAAHESQLMKAMETMVETIKGQGEMIKSLNDKIESFGGAGRGRKSVVSIVEKPEKTELKKSQDEGMDTKIFMMKALEANRQGRITSLDVSVAESAINKGAQVPAEIVHKVLG